MSLGEEIKQSVKSSAEQSLITAVRSLGGPILLERSVKLISHHLQMGRFLISLPKTSLYPQPEKSLAKICLDHGAPHDAYAKLASHLKAAHAIHFGFEPDGETSLFKCYLEFTHELAPKPNLVFMALKWSLLPIDTKNNYVETRYWSRNALTLTEKKSLIAEILPVGDIRMVACRMLDIADTLMHKSSFLEVDEVGNPRRSIDINIADAEYTLLFLREELLSVFKSCCVNELLLKDLLEREGSALLGHFAAGKARSGQTFASLYFGADFDQ